MNTREVVILSAVRTAIGGFCGALKDFEPADLGGLIIEEAVKRADVDPARVGFVTVGNVIPTEERYPYVSRVAAIRGGLSFDSVAMSVNRLCGSGMQALVSTAQAIMLGDAEYGLGVGVEVMSRGGFISPAVRRGSSVSDAEMFDAMEAVLIDPFGVGHMGVTAENLAVKWKISREDQDAFALESYRRATVATAEGHFKSQIMPLTVQTKEGEFVFDKDERPHAISARLLARMRPVFKKDGTVTAGNSSDVNDAAAALLMAEAGAAARAGHQPLARLVSYGIAGVSNELMGEGPIPASRIALQRAGLTLDQIDVVESNEAFAAQALTVQKGLGFDAARTNPNGGAIALGHPVGATGVILAVKAIHELQRIKGRYALITMCIGGGQGIAIIFERM